jgi:hypothetical protein
MEHIVFKIAYVAAVAVIVFVEHRIFSTRWRRRELARRTLGIATVLVLAFPLVIAGIFDLITYTWIWLGFGVAGALTALLYTNERIAAAEKKRGEFDAKRAGDWRTD